ncbi:MFS transporter [Actinospica durhamensis]|uniref:MFS transporter n=1 Tax=Actinospica durhamensis TaxID=1508375 RepID=A0A941EWZ0_9ACTN|nr:MFS transporter [Actinospica durhamensis]MBR7835474.1 MFS transporter [Actinospica durhamensis]
MPELTAKRRQLVLAICCMSLFIVGLDVTIVNVALPTIQQDFHASLSGLQWIMDGYTLVLASFLMLAGSTADRLGRRRIFRTGLLLFTLGSLLCSLAPGLGWLVAARILQALGGSMLNPVAMSIITNTFTEPKERARAIGVWSAVFGLSMALGPVLGGILVTEIGWRGIFWVNVPVGIAALVLTKLFVPESRAPRARRFDPVGQGLVIVVLACVTSGIIEGPRRGWGSPLIIGMFVLAAVAAALLVPYENRRREPLIDPRFFRSLPFSGATVIAVCAFLTLGGFLFLNALYLQDARGYTALHAGLLTLPMAAANLVSAPLSGRLVGSLGPRVPLVGASIAYLVAALLMTTFTPTTSLVEVGGAYVLMGLGFGLVNAPITNAAVSGMPRTQAGVAAAVASTSRQVGSSLGVAIFGSIIASGGTFAHASHLCWWLVVGCSLVIGALGILTTGARAKATAVRTAAIFEPVDATARPKTAVG